MQGNSVYKATVGCYVELKINQTSIRQGAHLLHTPPNYANSIPTLPYKHFGVGLPPVSGGIVTAEVAT